MTCDATTVRVEVAVGERDSREGERRWRNERRARKNEGDDSLLPGEEKGHPLRETDGDAKCRGVVDDGDCHSSGLLRDSGEVVEGERKVGNEQGMPL